MKIPLLALLLISTPLCAAPLELGLPPDAQVAQSLHALPSVQAAKIRIEAERAQLERLAAGPHEWAVRLGSQRRKAQANAAAEQQFSEWNVALERAIRLPGKSRLDSELGQNGISLAETAYGDALHEGGRKLLQHWFAWQKAEASLRQWGAMVKLLDQQAQGIRRREQLGDAARVDSIQAEAALAQAQAQWQQAAANQRTTLQRLRLSYPELGEAAVLTVNPLPPLKGSEAEWIRDILANNHELSLASGAREQARIQAERMRSERMPDPSFGVNYSRERAGEEQVVGAYISIPLSGTQRRAAAEQAAALAQAGIQDEQAIRRQVGAEAAALYANALASRESSASANSAAEHLETLAQMTARAYQLGEGSLSETLTARRLANEARLSANLLALEAREAHARLLLEAHRLWDFDLDH